MNAALIALATRIGAPLVESVLANAIGENKVRLGKQVLSTIASYAGVDVGRIDQLATSDSQEEREVIEQAVLMAESDMPQMIQLYTAELEGKMTLLEAEQKGPFWTWAWRPAGMWGLGFFWFYNIALLHWANAYFLISLPPVEFSILIQISALYMSLYMGGHTVKDVMSKWAGGRG